MLKKTFEVKIYYSTLSTQIVEADTLEEVKHNEDSPK